MDYLFTSESDSKRHLDKVAYQISDALIDHFMVFDPTSKVACETLVTTGHILGLHTSFAFIIGDKADNQITFL